MLLWDARDGQPLATVPLPDEHAVIDLGQLNGRDTLAVGTPGGALILVDLASGERRTIDWFDPIAALAIGPDNHIAIGDDKGYTVIRVP